MSAEEPVQAGALTLTELLEAQATDPPPPVPRPPTGTLGRGQDSLSASRAILKTLREKKGPAPGRLGSFTFAVTRLVEAIGADPFIKLEAKSRTLSRIQRRIEGILLRYDLEEKIADGRDVP